MSVMAPKQEDQRDLLDFLRNDPPVNTQRGERAQNWTLENFQVPVQAAGGSQIPDKTTHDYQWKQDPRIQALVADRMQQLESDARNESTQGKRKRSGRFNVTDYSNNASYRRKPF